MRIRQYPDAATLTGAEVLAISQNEVTVQTTVQAVVALASAAVTTVVSVNGQVGVVNLGAADVSADPAGQAVTEVATHDAAPAAHGGVLAAFNAHKGAGGVAEHAVATTLAAGFAPVLGGDASKYLDSTGAWTTPAGGGGGGGGGVPVGTILPFGGPAKPTGFEFCHGALLDRTLFSDLFAAIGTAWGVGDGVTTFAVPDLRRRGLFGSGGASTATLGNAVGSLGGEETHTLITAEMPAHIHALPFAGPGTGMGNLPWLGGANGEPPILDTASTGSGAAHNNMQPSAVVTFIIKSVP